MEEQERTAPFITFDFRAKRILLQKFVSYTWDSIDTGQGLRQYSYGVVLLWGGVAMGWCCYGVVLLWGGVAMGWYCYGSVLLWGSVAMGRCCYGADSLKHTT